MNRGIFMGRAVIIAECDQWANLERQSVQPLRMIVLLQVILDYSRVLPMKHEHRFLDFDAFDLVCGHGEWIESKVLEITVALRMNDSWISIRRQFKGLTVDDESLVQF